MSKPIHAGPMLPLALMAMVALVIPIISIANSKNTVTNSSAKMKIPANEPYKLGPTAAPTWSPTPTAGTYNGGTMQY